MKNNTLDCLTFSPYKKQIHVVTGITGALAIGLMVIHAVWALVVLIKKKEKAQINFRKFKSPCIHFKAQL